MALEDVEARLRAAVDTLRALPTLGPEGDDLIADLDMSLWPEIIPATWAAFQEVQVAARHRPTEAEVRAMQEAILWLRPLSPIDQEIVWLRAGGMQWRVLSQRVMVVRPRLWQRWRSATVEIARTAKGKAAPATHVQGQGARASTTSPPGGGGGGAGKAKPSPAPRTPTTGGGKGNAGHA